MRGKQRRRARGHSSMRHAVGFGLWEGGRGWKGRGGEWVGQEGGVGVYFKKQGAGGVICLLTPSCGGINV